MACNQRMPAMRRRTAGRPREVEHPPHGVRQQIPHVHSVPKAHTNTSYSKLGLAPGHPGWG
eukprot:5844103-Amphidinium_carterae.2